MDQTNNNEWPEYPLSECVDILDSQRIPVNSDDRTKRQGNIPYYGATGQVGWIDDYLFDEELVLLGEDGAPFLDKSKPIAYIIDGKSWVNNHAHVLRAKEGFSNNWFIKYYLDYFDFRDYVNGTTRLKLTQTSMKQIPVYLPDIKQQEKIAAKLTRIITEIKENTNRISKAKKLISKFRQAVLSAAVSGKLTEGWRERNPHEDTITIVEKLKQSRLENEGSVTAKKKIKNIYDYEESNEGVDLPESWRYVSLDKLCNSFQYGTSTKSDPIGKVPVLRMGNLQNGEIDWTNLVYTSDKNEIEKYTLKAGDVLFNRTNSPELVGKTSIYRGGQPAIFAGYLIKINNFPELNSEYLNYCLNSQYAREYCFQVKTDGVSQSNINAQKLGKFEVPFCSPAEQKEIVRIVKSFFEIASQVEKQIEYAEVRVSKLTQAILSKTFQKE